MNKYVVKLTETIWMTRVITAESGEQAKEIMQKAWEEGMLETDDGDIDLEYHMMLPNEDGAFLEYEEGN